MSSRRAGASSPTTKHKALSSSSLSTPLINERTHTPAAQGEVSKQRGKIRQPETPENDKRVAHDPNHQESKSVGDSGMAAQNRSLGPASRDRTRERGAVRSTEQSEFRQDVAGERAQATPDPKLHSDPAKLVIAFDIGTTYSGISYCIHEPGKPPETHAVTRFPAMEQVHSYAKVPSLLYYDESGKVRAAGFEVLTKSITEVALKEGWKKAEWWKLHLRSKHMASSIDKDLPSLPSGKSPVNVLTDFIKYLFKCVKSHIQEQHSTIVWSAVQDSVEYIFTYPNGWEGVQQRYRQAIESAGLIPTTPHVRSRVRMLTEGEASLHFCVTKFFNTKTTNQAPPRGVVIIDAGGGTIDSNVLSVTSNSVYYEEIAPAECRLQGSVFVTRRVKALLQRKLKGWERSSEDEISKFMVEFDQSTKLTIKSKQEPVYVKVDSRRYNNSKYDISFGKLKLSGEEATSLFDDSVDAIIEAFEKQEKLAKMPITTAFLVGGVSANDWLWSQLQSYFSSRKVSIYRPDNHSEAVAHGAVLCHIARENPLMASQVGRGACDVIERAIQNPKPGKSDPSKALDAVKSLRLRGEGLGNRMTDLENEIESLREVRRAHEQKHHCEVLYAKGRIYDVVESLTEIVNGAGEAVRTDKVIKDWLSEFQCRCKQDLEKRGDNAMDCKNFTEAEKDFSMIFKLSLDPVDRADILIKRNKARALMKSWKGALSDADEVIELSPSSHRGYEIKYAALHGMGRHAEAVEAFDAMLSRLKGSPDADIRKLRAQYVDARPTIRSIVDVTIRPMPRLLIDTTTGRLYDRKQQAGAFELLPIYSELVSSMTTRLDDKRIQTAVKEFYRYVMLSHRWEDGEPLLQQVKKISIYDLKKSPAIIKLQKFCLLVRHLGFRWAWSDTCCIDKDNNVVLQEALVTMFKWYRDSFLTVVYLRGVSSAGGLRNSIWNTRAWTYQEYVAAQTIRFYTEDWEPYLGLTLYNHKESPDVISEMQQATGVSAEEMAILRPGLNRVRQKLYLASGRKTTLVEDAAYSLFGIFDVALSIIYGERNKAVGRLLEHVLTGSGDVTVLAWTGASGNYNSCLPRDLTVYNSLAPPHVPLPIKKVVMDDTIKKSRLPNIFVMTLYQKLMDLPSPLFTATRLRLSGIISTITKPIQTYESYSETHVRLHIYRVTTAIFEDIEIKTTEDLTGMKDVCVVHPWIRPLLDQEHALRGAAAADKTTSALRLIVRLWQPFGALVFVPLSRVEHRRVATDDLIMAQIKQKVSLESLIDAINTIEIH